MATIRKLGLRRALVPFNVGVYSLFLFLFRMWKVAVSSWKQLFPICD